MNTHDERPKVQGDGGLCVLDGQHRVTTIADLTGQNSKVLPIYDATPFVGLKTTVHNAAIVRVDESGDETIELPKPRELRAAAAITRCLMPLKLRGWEIKAMRKIMGLTLAELAQNLDERTAVETLSRWESEAQPMGGYAEKLLRLYICETLHKEARGVAYSGSMIAYLRVKDPWRSNENYEIPAIVLKMIHLKETGSDEIIETWNSRQAA